MYIIQETWKYIMVIKPELINIIPIHILTWSELSLSVNNPAPVWAELTWCLGSLLKEESFIGWHNKLLWDQSGESLFATTNSKLNDSPEGNSSNCYLSDKN